MYNVDRTVSMTFLEKKVKYESLNQAIKKAKQSEAKESEINELIVMRSKAKQDYFDKVSNLLDKYFLVRKNGEVGSNLIKLLEGWYGIAYYSDKKTLDIKFELLIEKDVYMLERDTNCHHYGRVELERIVPAYTDESALEIYKHKLQQRALEIIHDHVPSCQLTKEVSVQNVINNTNVRPSVHASKRWVQRIMNIHSETQAEEYRRSHFKEIDKDIEKGFSTASKVWEGSDGVSYWFDTSNIMYVVGNNTIITLYEEDFGFTKEINRSIVTLQIEEVRKSQKELDIVEKEHNELVNSIDNDISSLDADISELQVRMSYLNSCKSTLVATREQSMKGISLEREHFNNQFNKLFKKWEV